MNPFKIIELNQTASTQTYITNTDTEKPFEEYTVIFTSNQTAGRGQGTHIWESEEGKNISFSLLLQPVFLNPAQQFLITQFVSLAIADTLADYGLQNVKIKWPNDIYVGEKKICGMLIQNSIMRNKIFKTYIGIGINVNQKTFCLAPNPTSLLLETGKEYGLRKFLDDTLYNIYVRYSQLKENKIPQIQKQYLSLLLFKNQKRTYIYKGKEISAQIENVNSFGHLLLRLDNGSVLECELRQLQFVF